MKKIAPFLFLFIFVTVFSSYSNERVVDKIVATVEGHPITAYEITNIAGFYNTQDPVKLVDMVIDDYIIMNYAKNLGIVVTDEDIDKYIEALAERNGFSEGKFLAKVKASGVDMDYYRLGIKLQIYKQKFALKMFASSIKISKDEIDRYYVLHKKQLNPGLIFVMSIISTKDKKTAKIVYKGLSNGGDFYKLKKQFSMDKTKVKTIPESAFNKEIRKKLLKLKKGEYSDIIESNGTYYIIKLIDKKTASNDETLVAEQIKNILFGEAIESKLNSWLKMVKNRTDIEVFE